MRFSSAKIERFKTLVKPAFAFDVRFLYLIETAMRTFSLKERILSRLNLLPIPIYDVFAAPLFGQTLALAVRTGLFELLHRAQSAEEVALKAKIHPHAASVILSSLASTSYLKKIDNKFILARSAKKWLVQSSPTYLGNFIRYVQLLYSRWLFLDETIKHGEPPVTYIESFGEKEWKIYVLGMMDLAKIIIPHVRSKLKIPGEAGNLLDLGGGHGLYSIELCRYYPQLRATVVDFPQVTKFTRQILEEQKMTDRVSLEASNVLEMKFETSYYDAVLAFNIVHGLTGEQNRLLIRNTATALKPGGVLYILDQFITRRVSKIGQFVPLMVGINIMNEVGGNVYSLAELREWASASGLERMRVFKLRLPGIQMVRLEKHQ